MLTDALMSALTVLCAVNAALAWAFVWRYRRHQDWRKYPTGRHLMRFTRVLALVFTFQLVFQFLADLIPMWLAASIAVALFAGLAFELTNRLRIEGRAYKARQAREAAEREAAQSTPGS